MAITRTYHQTIVESDDSTSPPTARANDSTLTHGQLYMTGNATATTITTTGTYVKIAGATTANLLSVDLTAADNKLTYTGDATKLFKPRYTVCGSTTASNITYGVKIYKNGVVFEPSITCSDFHTANKIESFSGECYIELAKDDYLEVFIANLEDTQDVTVDTSTFVLGSV